jgi:hypothetical protein
MKELMKEADIAAREMGDTKIRAIHVSMKIGVCPLDILLIKKTLAKFRG